MGGEYDRVGLLSARPFFLQAQRESEPSAKGKTERLPRYALWYAEDEEQWVITEDFRLLDPTSIDARATDSSWFPWDISELRWEIADGQGGFIEDINLAVENISYDP